MQIYSREFIERHGLRFEEGIVHEDTIFSFSSLIKARRAAVLDEPFYIRRIRRDSLMTVPSSFDNVYGYYSAMKEMLFQLGDDDGASPFSEDEYRAVFALVNKMCRRAAKMYGLIGEKEIVSGFETMSSFDRAFMTLTVRSAWRNRALVERKEQLKEKLSLKRELISELRRQQKELEHIKKSFSYRLGRALTALPRRILTALKRN
jgi:hypothetical protein